jgi:hypothetical protein
MPLIKLETIENIMLTIFETANIEHSVPVSLLLVAPSGEAKSSIIKQHCGESVIQTDGFTQKGLWDIVSRDPENKISYITVPDLNPTLSRQPKVVEAAIGNLLTLTFDGSVRMDDGRQEKIFKHRPIGFIGAMTPELYTKYAKKWFALGLRRRVIPFFYEYSFKTIEIIQEEIRKGKVHRQIETMGVIHSKNGNRVSPVISVEHSHALKELSSRLAILLGKTKVRLSSNGLSKYKWITDTIAPIDPHMLLRTIAQANALKHKRGRVENVDVEFAVDFCDFCDPERPKQV